MKSLRLLLCGLLFPLLLSAFHARGAAPDGEAMRADVEARLRAFYAFYCHGMHASQSLFDNAPKLKPYVSARFIKEIHRLSKVEGGIDADPFVCAQDTDDAWEKNVKVAHVKTAGDGSTATADVTLAGPALTVHLHVSLVNESGVYKVDKVKSTDP